MTLTLALSPSGERVQTLFFRHSRGNDRKAAIDIGDFAGLTIAYTAFMKSLEGKPRPANIDGFTPEQRFFLGWAQVWAAKSTAEAERLQLSAEQSARAQAEAAQARFAFLAEASTRLASSLDYELTLRNVAELAVPALADACTVDVLLENGDVRRVAATRLAEGALEGQVLVRVPLEARGRVLGATRRRAWHAP